MGSGCRRDAIRSRELLHMVRFFTRWVFGLLGVVLPAALLGCGSRTATVSGVVTLEGKPVNAGGIAFTSANNYIASGVIEQDGTYRIGNAPIGDVVVTIRKATPVMKPEPGADPSKRPKESSLPTATPIPAKYAQPDNGLGFTVTGNMTKDFDLTP
jgi:hypothetical protein